MANGDVVMTLVIDRSGSMSSIRKSTIDAVNEFKQQVANQPGKTWLTVMLFNQSWRPDGGEANEFTITASAVPIAQVVDLDSKNYKPDGGTPLNDAIGIAVRETEQAIERLGSEVDADTKRLVVIMTDGMENTSKEYNYTDIRTMIKEKQEEGWDFVYLGAGLDSFSAAQRYGVRTSSNFIKGNMNQSYAGLTRGMAAYRTASSASRLDATQGLTEAVAVASPGASVWHGDEDQEPDEDAT